MRLAHTTLYTMTLSEYNNHVEKLVQVMELKIKLLSCKGEEPSLIFANIFRIFRKITNNKLKSLVYQYSKLYDKGDKLESDFLLKTFV